MSDSWPNDWKNKSLTLDEARGELPRIAAQVRGALAGLGLCYQAKNGYVYEVQFSRLDILPDGDDPLLGLITVNRASALTACARTRCSSIFPRWCIGPSSAGTAPA